MKTCQIINLLFILLLNLSISFSQNEITFENLQLDNFYESVEYLEYDEGKRITFLHQIFGMAIYNTYRIDAPKLIPFVTIKDSTVTKIDCFIDKIMHSVNPDQKMADRLEIEYFYSPDLIDLDAKIFNGYTLSWNVKIDEEGVHQIHLEDKKAYYTLFVDGQKRISGFYEPDLKTDTTIIIDPATFEKTMRITRRDSYNSNRVGKWKYYDQEGEVIREEEYE